MADLKSISINGDASTVPELTKEAVLALFGYEELEVTATDGTKYNFIGIKTLPEKYHTVLYTDGAFIINEPESAREANTTAHGEAVKEYVPLDAANDYVFANKEACPWASERGKIKAASFGSVVAPTSLAYWFAYSGVASVDWTNCDTSEMANAKSMFYGDTSIASITLPDLPAATDAGQMFRDCTGLKTVEMTGIDIGSLKTASGMFQGCTNLTTVNMSGTDTSAITDSQRMFADNTKLRTIYATEDCKFTQATASNNMFRSCSALVGGNGTAFNSSYIDKTYARLDVSGTPGYFTEKKELPENVILEAPGKSVSVREATYEDLGTYPLIEGRTVTVGQTLEMTVNNATITIDGAAEIRYTGDFTTQAKATAYSGKIHAYFEGIFPGYFYTAASFTPTDDTYSCKLELCNEGDSTGSFSCDSITISILD